MRPEDCNMKLGQQGIEVCDKFDEYQHRQYLNYLIQNIQYYAQKNIISCIEGEMAVHFDAILNEDRI